MTIKGLSHLSEGQCLWLYYLQQEENHCQLSDFMTRYTFECLEDVGGPDPHQTQKPPKENMHGGGGYPSWGCFAASIQHATLRETCGSSSETIDPTPWINASEMKLFRNKIRVSDWSNTSVDMKHTQEVAHACKFSKQLFCTVRQHGHRSHLTLCLVAPDAY